MRTHINITPEKYSQLFKNYDGCFLIYSVNNHKIISEYNPKNHCNQRIAPDSTFKIPLSLMAFDQGIIKQKTVFKWDGKKGILSEHDRDQTPDSWIKYSVVWVSQQITPQLGYPLIKRYLDVFDYGNQDFTGDSGKNNGLKYAWLSSSLKISAVEQLHFLNAMVSNKLPVTHEAIVKTKDNMYLGKLANGADYYGKTGSGRHGRNEREGNPSQIRDGWFVGFIEQGKQTYIFVSNLTDKLAQDSIENSTINLKPFGSQLLLTITMQLLNEYFAK
ncbi:hypothetical protein TUM19329_19990 [Legionella antarctica]|uniref:Beta-lactamase n=1 Tax=Legionella antarctica TaxID=2708020 RepID=A0A6F8T5F5_9GAMM|nr:class D beta-lactamase [Legionella antarctica]BCA95638.1 hypothetical protein TUM19329_19990 [Legionella antarctica]